MSVGINDFGFGVVDDFWDLLKLKLRFLVDVTLGTNGFADGIEV